MHQRNNPAPAAALALQAALALPGGELLAWRRAQLSRGGRPVDLDWLLDLVAGVDWATLQRLRLEPQQMQPLRSPLAEVAELWSCHLDTAQPLQYLAGVCPWRDLQLTVAPAVLIPRQETELLVELAQALGAEAPPALWADLGTGSGCLAVALARLWPASAGLAVDCSPEALRQAGLNLHSHGVADRVQPLLGSWWQPLAPWWGALGLVVANPPYIPTAVWDALEPEVKCHEPRQALDGGADGLGAISAIVAGARQALAPGGWLVLEHHHDQSACGAAAVAGRRAGSGGSPCGSGGHLAICRGAPFAPATGGCNPAMIPSPSCGDMAAQLRRGAVVLMPTDTLPALAARPEHAQRIWSLKQRPAWRSR
jgi:release factor glutamine methyltransferase